MTRTIRTQLGTCCSLARAGAKRRPPTTAAFHALPAAPLEAAPSETSTVHRMVRLRHTRRVPRGSRVSHAGLILFQSMLFYRLSPLYGWYLARLDTRRGCIDVPLNQRMRLPSPSANQGAIARERVTPQAIACVEPENAILSDLAMPFSNIPQERTWP